MTQIEAARKTGNPSRVSFPYSCLLARFLSSPIAQQFRINPAMYSHFVKIESCVKLRSYPANAVLFFRLYVCRDPISCPVYVRSLFISAIAKKNANAEKPPTWVLRNL